MEIKEMLEAISKHKQEERQKLESFNYKQLKQLKKKSYVPKTKTQEDLVQEIKIKRSWKGAGAQNNAFSQVPVMRGVVLNEWEAERTIMPERTYKLPKGAAPIKYTKPYGDFFPGPKKEMYPQRFRERLEKVECQYKEFAERPAKHGVLKEPPKIVDKNFKGVKHDRVAKEFNWGKHTSWEGFQKTLTSKH